MSASREKIRRQEERGAGTDKRAQEVLDRKKDAKRTKNLAILVTAAFLVLALVVVLLSTSLLYGLTAIRCGDVRYSTADYNYFYGNLYNNYYSSYQSYYGEYAQYFMPDSETLRADVLESMEDAALLYSQAKKAGYELSEEGQNTVQMAVHSVEAYAQLSGVSKSAYLRNMYGDGVTMRVFQRNVELTTLAAEYQQHVLDSFEFSDDACEAYYVEHADEFDIIQYRSYFVTGAAVEDDPDTEEDETVTAEDAMAEAKISAEEFLSRLKKGETFAELAYEYSNESTTYEDEDATLHEFPGGSLSDSYSEWLLDGARKTGDAEIAEYTSGYYVVQYLGRTGNDYVTKNVRHVLVRAADVNQADYDTPAAYDEAVAAAQQAAHDRAQELYDAWLGDDLTEQSFLELADAFSNDTNAPGGLYENVYRGEMQKPFEDWCYDASRQPGDTDLIQTDYGWHIMYFVGDGEIYRKVLADDALKSAAYEEWEAELAPDYEYRTNLFYNLYCKK